MNLNRPRLHHQRAPKVAVLTCIVFAAVWPGAAVACARVDQLDGLFQGEASATKECTRYLGQNGGQGVSCFWSFPFRAPEAPQFADAIWAEVQSCRPGKAAGPDALVNHPDSYDLRVWITDGATYHLSLKDKGGLQQTLVFLRIEG